MAKGKIHFMNSALSIPQTFSCALDTFLGKTSCLFFPRLSNLAVTMDSQSFFLARAQDIVESLPFYFFLVDVFDRK